METCRVTKLENCVASDALQDASIIRLTSHLNCVAFKPQACGTSYAFQVTPLHILSIPSATRFQLPKVYCQSRSEHGLKVLAANVSHNAHKSPHLHRLIQIYTNSLGVLCSWA